MSRRDPACFTQLDSDDRRVCARCFDDDDLKYLIRSNSGPRGCSFCGRRDAVTIPLCDIAEYIKERLETFYGRAVEQLPYESREGGYQGWHVDTYDLLFDTVGLALPRDQDASLAWALAGEIGDEAWCEYDWLALAPDDSLLSSWEQFCEIIKHRRRFFFHVFGATRDRHPDSRSPVQFLRQVCFLIERSGLVCTKPAGHRLYRARPRAPRERHTTAASLGPPPLECATQSNRMNPPGIPMFYGAETASLAIAETRAGRVSVGMFEVTRAVRLLNLAKLPELPGFFSSATREETLALRFLHEFSRIIVEPIPRDERVHVDYIPTQVFTEFLRDYHFESGHIDGVLYRSAAGRRGNNVALFAGPEDVHGAVTESQLGEALSPWLKLIGVRQR